MTTSDVSAAAERVLAEYARRLPEPSVYPLEGPHRFPDDVQAVCNATVAFTDPTPIDEAWLREQFGNPGFEFEDHRCWLIGKAVEVNCIAERITVNVGCQRIFLSPTRGQLAMLLAALGLDAGEGA